MQSSVTVARQHLSQAWPKCTDIHQSTQDSGSLSSIHEVWAVVGQLSASERDRQPHPGRHIFSQYLGQWKDPCRTSLPRTSECQAESSLGIIALQREQKSVKGSKRAQGEQISPPFNRGSWRDTFVGGVCGRCCSQDYSP